MLTALLNNQVAGKALAHGLSIAEADHAIVEGELAAAYKSAAPTLTRSITPWVFDGEAGKRGWGGGGQDMKAALDNVSAIPVRAGSIVSTSRPRTPA